MKTKSKVSVKVNVAKPVPPPVESVELNLVLTPREASAFLALTGQIGGSPDRSARGLFGSIRESLFEAGVKESKAFQTDGTIYFQDYSKYSG